MVIVPVGAWSSVTSGAVVSTVKLEALAGLVLPAGSTARTAAVWTPSARPVSCQGLVQSAHASPSRRHWKVAVGSVLENANCVSPVVIVPLGCWSTRSVGAVVSARWV